MKYPIGIQNFEDLRRNGYAYVDKTQFVYKLADEGKYYFQSRPRRFGKSLFLSTLEAYFQGKKELFEGLAIYELETEWKQYPIFHIDLNTANFREEGSLYNVLNDYLTAWEDKYGTRESEVTLPLRFKGVIARAAEKEGRNVVILVDEYDKPILQTLQNEKLQEDHRNQLKAYYSVLKPQDRYIKFAFLTGVTKFGKISVFSDLNNLMDLSMDHRYINICRITEKELLDNFKEGINELAETIKGDSHERELSQMLRTAFKFASEDASNIMQALRKANEDYLSESEKEAIDASIQENASLSFEQLKNKSHDKIWLKDFREGKGKKVISTMNLAESAHVSEAMKEYIKEGLGTERALAA